MQIRRAPQGLSNTALSSCDDIIKKLSGDTWTVKIRLRPIYKLLAEHDIFKRFAYSNQALCKELRPFFEKMPSESEFKSKLKSLENKIRYDGPQDNNLLEYLSNLLLYKAFLLDARSQIPQGRVDEYNQKIGPQNIKKLQDQEKKIEQCKEYFLDQEESLQRQQNYIKEICSSDYNSYETCEKVYQQREETRNGYQSKGYDTAEKDSEEYRKFEDSQDLFDAIYDDYQRYKAHRRIAKKHEEAAEKYKEALEEFKAMKGYDLYPEYKKLREHEVLREYPKLDYKVSIHIRFARTMNALNAYTRENFTTKNLRKYGEPYHETGISDEYGRRIVKYLNLMNLERRKINRYVTVQYGGVYTTVAVERNTTDPNRLNERTKFRYTDEKQETSNKSVPVWDYRACEKKDTYTLEERIKDSCDTFNKQIDKYVVSTYANYYGVNNVLRVQDKRLHLKYMYTEEEARKTLEIPRYVGDDNKYKEAPLHILIKGGRAFQKRIYNPQRSDGFTYEPIPYKSRDTGSYDIIGLLYAIRKDKIAVSFIDTKQGFHSSLWSGKKVQTAGLLAAWNGKLIAVDNMSGHYRPNWFLTYHAWQPFYRQGVFHEKAILGIAVGVELQGVAGFYCQYFTIKAFMTLAARDFVIGETVKELECHVKRMKEVSTSDKGFHVSDQSACQECSDVLLTPHVSRYHRMWKVEDDNKTVARAFVAAMQYDWDSIVPGAKASYNLFRGKKRLLLPRKNNLENTLKKRTKRLQEAITKNHNLTDREEVIKQEKERKEALKAATDHYKEVLAKIGKNADLRSSERYDLIKCVSDIYFANDAYSELTAKVVGTRDEAINECQKKIDTWVRLLQPLVQAKADKRAGLDVGRQEGYQLGPTQPIPEREDADNLENGVDVTSEVEPAVKATRLRLVDRHVYETQQQSKKTQSPPQPKTSQPSPQPKAPTSQTSKKPRSGGGPEYRCLECGDVRVITSYDKSYCRSCGKMGCLERVS